MKRESLQTFNDGVIAIIITLMVLEIKLPGFTAADYWLLAQHVGIYAISFVVIAIFWMNTHAILDAIDCIDHKAVWLNLLLLFCLSLMPLPTEALGEHPHDRSANLFFGVVLTVSALMYAAFHAAVEADIGGVTDEGKRALRRKNILSISLAVLSLPLAFLSTWISLGIFVLVPALYFLPSRHMIKAANGRDANPKTSLPS